LTGQAHLVRAGDTPLAIAARYNITLPALAQANELTFPYRLYPGQRLRLPGDRPFYFLPGEWDKIEIRPLPIVQGETSAIYVESLFNGRPSGHFAGQPLRFVPHNQGFIALVGLDAFTEPGFYLLELEGSGERPWHPFSQTALVTPGNYGTQLITVGEEIARLLEPAIRAEEDNYLATLFGQFSETQQWDGLFQMPLTTTIVTAGYGGARSYNGGPFDIFHTGIDFAAPIGTAVLAPANGRVLFTGELQLRGNTVIVDHGLGVMTGYFHLSAIQVETGQSVSTGQPLAAVGSTGLSSGSHLHWDLRVLNTPVNPLQWTNHPFP
jgi:murein DD-endopeptidase MepM/ murein hydrolase activator NlpD